MAEEKGLEREQVGGDTIPAKIRQIIAPTVVKFKPDTAKPGCYCSVGGLYSGFKS